jgi:prepilin-type N-terminal cleavage/methylation domain-containing protein
MKEKGFTLVELIAVIVILGLIGIIIVPTVNDTIQKQRKKTFQTSVYGLLDTVKSESQNAGFTTKVYRFQENELYECDENGDNCSVSSSLTTDGKIKSGQGYIKVTKDGFYSLSVSNNNYCSFKTYYNDIVITDNEDYCEFGDTVNDVIDEIANYDKQDVSRIFYLNDGTLALLNENGMDLDPEVIITSGFLDSAEGYFESNNNNIEELQIRTSNFCAYLNGNETIEFSTHSCSLLR